MTTVRHSRHPIIFDDYFELGLEETSPFLTPESRGWARQLPLKSSFVAGGCLICSFALSFYPALLPFSYLLLALVYFFAGVPSLIDSIEDLSSLDVNIDMLMTLAAFDLFYWSGFEGGFFWFSSPYRTR